MRSPRPILTLPFVLAATFALSAPALSQPKASGASDAQQADEHFRKGKELLKAGSKKEAREEYLAAFRLKRSYDVAGNLGSLELTLGLPRDAAEHLSFALRSYASSGTTPEQLEKAKQRLADAERQVGTVKLTVSVEGAEVLVDGKPVGRAPLGEEVFVESGERRIEARLSGYEPAKQTITIAKGQAAAVTLTLAAVAAAPVPSAAVVPVATVVPSAAVVPVATGSASASTPPLPTGATMPIKPPPRGYLPGVVLGGVGLAAAVSGAVLFAVSSSKLGDAETLGKAIDAAGGYCINPGSSVAAQCNELHSTTKDVATLHDAGVGLLVGGGVLALAGVAYLLWPSPKAAPTSSFRVAPTVTSTSQGLLVEGSF
jgi:PEGA domain